MQTELRNLSASRLKALRACQRLHHYEYDLGYRPVRDADVLRFGDLFHRGLRAWWDAKMASDPEPLAQALQVVQGEADPFDRVRAEELLAAYHLRWNDQPYEVLAVEQRFETALVNPGTGAASRTWQLVGQLDAVVRDLRDGRVLVVEHKTSSEDISPGAKYWQRLRMDGQVSVYFEGGKSLGYDVAAVLYDVAAKPGILPKGIPVTDDDGVKIVLDSTGNRVRTKDGKKWRETGDSAAGYVLQTRPETPEEFRVRYVEAIAADPNAHFGRAEVVRLEQEMSEALFDVWQLGQQLRDSERLARYPRNPDSCIRFGRECAFWDVCTGVASLDDKTRFTKREDASA